MRTALREFYQMKFRGPAIIAAALACLGVLVAAVTLIWMSSGIAPQSERVLFQSWSGTAFWLVTLRPGQRLHVSVGNRRQRDRMSDQLDESAIVAIGDASSYLLRVVRHTEGGRLASGEYVLDYTGVRVSLSGVALLSFAVLVLLLATTPLGGTVLGLLRSTIRRVDSLFGGRGTRRGFDPVIKG